MCRVFICHFIVYNFYDTIFNVYVLHRPISWNFWFACDAGFHCIKLVITNPNHVKVREIKYCFFEFQPYVQKLFYIQFTMNQTNHNNSCLLIVIFMPCVVSQGTRKPIHKKSCIPSLFCVSTPLLSCFEVKKTTQFDWFRGLNLKTNCTFPADFSFQPAVEKLSVGSGCNIYYLLLLLFVAKPCKTWESVRES